jgi:hypothetical protein
MVNIKINMSCQDSPNLFREQEGDQLNVVMGADFEKLGTSLYDYLFHSF